MSGNGKKPLIPITTIVLPDEPCWGLKLMSENRAFPDGSHQRRFVETIRVIRSDRIAHYITDFGPADDFEHIPPLMIPSFGENTVAELQAMSEDHRHDLRWQKRREEMLAESTLIQDILRQAEENRDIIANRSRFGPGGQTQRNEYDRNPVRRYIKSKTRRIY